MNGATLYEAERILRLHSGADVEDDVGFAGPECVELVRAVEDEEAWKGLYPSLEAFYAAHELRHPGIRYYGAVRRETADARSPGGSIGTRLKPLRGAD